MCEEASHHGTCLDEIPGATLDTQFIVTPALGEGRNETDQSEIELVAGTAGNYHPRVDTEKNQANNTDTYERYNSWSPNGGFFQSFAVSFLVVAFFVAEIYYIYGPGAALNGEEDERECLPVPDVTDDDDVGELVTTIVADAMFFSCDCLPLWMMGGVYFDPVATAYLALATALGFMLWYRLTPLFPLCAQSISSFLFNKSNNIRTLTIRKSIGLYHHLPPTTQRLILVALRESFPTMPDIGPRPLHVTSTPSESEENSEMGREFEKWASVQKDLSGNVKSLLDKRNNLLKNAPLEQLLDGLEANDNELREKMNEMLNAKPMLKQTSKLEDKSPISDGAAATVEELVGTGEVKEISGYSTKNKECSSEDDDDDDEEGGEEEDEEKNKDGDILSSLASAKWVAWYCDLEKDKKKRFEAAIFASVDALDKETHEVSSRNLSVVFFTLQLFTGIIVLIDYFAVQVKPSGASWMCRPAYVMGVMMYKPFTIPLWSCLTLCCHYTFAERLYGNYGREVDSGTPYGSPIPRSMLSVVLVCTVAFLQAAWFFGVLPMVLPLALIFFPALLLPALLGPLALIFGVQELLGRFVPWFQLLFAENALRAVKRDGLKLQILRKKLKADKEVVLAAVQQNGNALEFAANDLKADKEIVLAAVEQNGKLLEFAANDLKADKEIVLAAVQQDGKLFGAEKRRLERR